MVKSNNGKSAFTPRGDRDSIISLPGAGFTLRATNHGPKIQDSYIEESYDNARRYENELKQHVINTETDPFPEYPEGR